jgi:hypothetical protein
VTHLELRAAHGLRRMVVNDLLAATGGDPKLRRSSSGTAICGWRAPAIGERATMRWRVSPIGWMRPPLHRRPKNQARTGVA